LTSSAHVAELQRNTFENSTIPPSLIIIAVILSELRSGGICLSLVAEEQKKPDLNSIDKIFGTCTKSIWGPVWRICMLTSKVKRLMS